MGPVPVENPCVPQPQATAQVPSAGAPTPDTARAGSIVPVRRPALTTDVPPTADVLALDYPQIHPARVERRTQQDRVITCQDIAVARRPELCPASMEEVRSKTKRLADRDRAAEPAPGRFTLADGPSRRA